MSPTATIAAVVVALVFCAWLFQTDLKDPGYDALVRRQLEEKKSEQAQKAAMGIAVTDPGVTKDESTLDARRGIAKPGDIPNPADPLLAGDSIPGAPVSNDPGNPATHPAQL